MLVKILKKKKKHLELPLPKLKPTPLVGHPTQLIVDSPFFSSIHKQTSTSKSMYVLTYN